MTQEQVGQQNELMLDIKFVRSIPGFPDILEYSLIESHELKPFYILQPNEADFTFLLIHTFDYFTDYDFTLSLADKEILKLASDSKVFVFSIVNRRNGLRDATVNLKAPIVVNPVEKIAAQIILEDNTYMIDEPLLAAIQKSR